VRISGELVMWILALLVAFAVSSTGNRVTSKADPTNCNLARLMNGIAGGVACEASKR